MKLSQVGVTSNTVARRERVELGMPPTTVYLIRLVTAQSPHERTKTRIRSNQMSELRRRGNVWWIHYYRSGNRYEAFAHSMKSRDGSLRRAVTTV